ncbi:NADPH-dependent FMN reductase [Ornithinimicrobium pratense]|uniref:NAD(P)H-dependent oxidoreductase n=1 Tax=Ornithinimicrobium pratense TaxID=2593973 RepID=A0A5J6V2F7_9MICO|nr:NAD(P)H-dependent oxidoreductase [Ornithinimicrobium pratense]QFG67494.1 NAD(P)H-dependent oxidoreductase [Ornithinimicrobium pratense]
MSMRIGVVISSTRSTRIGDKVAAWVAQQAPEGVEAQLVDLREVDLPFMDEPAKPAMGDYVHETTKAWGEMVSGFDAMIFVVAEYNGGYTAQLKNAVDTLFAEWNDLPIGVVGYGYGGAARAVAALEPVLATVKAVRVPGPGLLIGQHLSPEGEFLQAAPADEMRALFEAVRAQAPALV